MADKQKAHTASRTEAKAKRERAMKVSAAALIAVSLVLGGCSSNSQNNAANTSDAASNDEATANSGSTANASDDSASNAAHDEGSKGTNSSSDSSSATDEPADDRGDSPALPEKGDASQYDDSKPGQLTAGEWDDSFAWQTWQRLLKNSEGRESQAYWSMFPQNRLEVVVTAGGKPVSDATVTLTGSDGEAAWEARTNIKGVAYAYAGMFDEQDSQEPYGVEVTFGEQKKRYENVPVPRSQALKIELDEPVKASDALDLMLLVDTTGSMQDELDYLKTELKDVVSRVEKDNGQQLGIRVSANFYRDHSDDYVVRAFPFTEDIDQVEGQLADQEAAGGGDFPEAVDEALANAIDKHDWSDNARARLLFLVMDAPPHHERKVTKRIQDLTEEAAAEGIRIVPIASSGVDVHTEYLMRFIASATGGTYLFLTDHSGIGNDHLEPAVGEYEVKALNDLLVDVINRYSAEQQ